MSGGAHNASGGAPSQGSGGSAAGGTAGGAECAPPIAEGTAFRVTVLQETSTSDKCHVINAARLSPFTITAGKTDASQCSTTPAVGPPEQNDVTIVSCVPPPEDAMLGTYCQIVYKAGCDGHMLFSFRAPSGVTVDFGAPVVEGAQFRIQDFSPNCFSDQSNCLDEYVVRLERLQ